MKRYVADVKMSYNARVYFNLPDIADFHAAEIQAQIEARDRYRQVKWDGIEVEGLGQVLPKIING